MSSVAVPLNIETPITLEGSVVRLEPIRRDHAGDFWNVAENALDNIFEWIPYRLKTREDFERLVQKAFDEQKRGESIVFATVERSSGRVIGSTRFMNIDASIAAARSVPPGSRRRGNAPPSIPKQNI